MQTDPLQTLTGIWLTDPTVPAARPIWAVRRGRFGTKVLPAWRPTEDTLWYDQKSQTIYAATESEVTDFSSTPAGDGHRGPLRGAGRLHDLMSERTPVLRPLTPAAVTYLHQKLTSHSPGEWIDEIWLLDNGWHRDIQPLSIWAAGGLFSRMLTSAGFPRWRAALMRFGLRGLQLHRLYRWLWADSSPEYLRDREGLI
ncbi:hypothetical protein QEH52_01855 [Coraliomargarita sp. SDUM461003]|uniref:Uncharacterized protein n=1 Tax=Thalassobacterium maritimum TaxID=3041265 RepID=A0ABU1ARJ3_9BACT|nr:hypothetical protein [Coraliomargarita sp. SDUM461003]MDQ8206237.1 hypothetical protein [Coraliomargarita sp. SDUM461003]